MMNKNQFNNIWIGVAAGIIAPTLALLIFYLARYSKLSIADFLAVYKNLGVLTHIISLAVIPDLLIFFLFIRKDFLKSARGVLLATFLFTLVVICIRFF